MQNMVISATLTMVPLDALCTDLSLVLAFPHWYSTLSSSLESLSALFFISEWKRQSFWITGTNKILNLHVKGNVCMNNFTSGETCGLKKEMKESQKLISCHTVSHNILGWIFLNYMHVSAVQTLVVSKCQGNFWAC